MPVIKIGIKRDSKQLKDRMRRLVDDFSNISGPMVLSCGAWVPAIDIYEGPDAVYVVADAAGIDTDSLHLVLEGHFLRLVGQRCSPVSLKKRRFYQMEIEYGSFERIVRIPVPVDPDRLEAVYENGMLVVKMSYKRSDDTIKINIS